jgi:hypothetical protein
MIREHQASKLESIHGLYTRNLRLVPDEIESRVIRTPAMLSARCFSLIVG